LKQQNARGVEKTEAIYTWCRKNYSSRFENLFTKLAEMKTGKVVDHSRVVGG